MLTKSPNCYPFHNTKGLERWFVHVEKLLSRLAAVDDGLRRTLSLFVYQIFTPTSCWELGVCGCLLTYISDKMCEITISFLRRGRQYLVVVLLAPLSKSHLASFPITEHIVVQASWRNGFNAHEVKYPRAE